MSLGGIRQYGRRVRVEVGRPGTKGARFEGLRIGFNVTKTDSKKPNKGKIQVYNLKESSRSLLEEDGAKVFLFAGYENADLIFSGDVDDVQHAWDARDLVSEIEAADGRSKYTSGQLFQTFDPPLDSSVLLRRLAAAMPIEFGNIPPDLEVVQYTQGYTVAGPVRDALDEVTETIGCRWSIQDDELIVTRIGEGLRAQAFLVSANTGLIGRPKKTKRGIKFTMLLNGAVKPRMIIKLDSEDFKGFYLAKKVTFVGDSGFDDSFYCEVEARERSAS